MLINDEMVNDVKYMALSFSYTDEIDESYEDSTDEDDFESLGDDTLNKFDDEIYDDSLDEDDVNVSYDFEYPEDYNDEITEDYASDEA